MRGKYSCYNRFMSDVKPRTRGNKFLSLPKVVLRTKNVTRHAIVWTLPSEGRLCVARGIYSHASCSHALLLAFIFLLFFCLLPVHAQAPLAPTLDKILNAPALKGGVTGAIVCRVRDGKTLYAHDADLRLLPASNRKLFTSAAALELLGPDFRVHTDILAAARPDANGTIAGSVYLRGGGDGLLSPSDLDAMAGALVQAGVKRIDGGVVGDGTCFADGPYGFGWEWDDFSDEEFPQISGLEVSEGVLEVRAVPGRASGDPVTVTVDPPTDYVPLTVTAQTAAKDAADTCTISRPWDKNEFQIAGTLPLGQTLTQKVPVQAPPLLAAALLQAALVRHGITVSGKAAVGQTAPNAMVLATHSSLPLSEYIVRMNKPSDNLLAESLVRELDSAGTYDAGHARETPFFRSLGVDTEAIALVDGCGVGRRNFVTARAVSQLLLGMHRERNWPLYYASLPIAGVDGTLKGRMIGTPAQNNVHAKTGTLSQARALSGYVTGRSGQLYVFSLLMNNFSGNARSAGAVQDQFVEYLAAHL